MQSWTDRVLVAAAGVAAVAALGWAAHLHWRGPAPAILLAPMIGHEPCTSPTADTLAWDPPAQKELFDACWGPKGSAGQLVESTLAGLEPNGPAQRRYELGYTMNVHLLKLFRQDGDGWKVDPDRVARHVRTLKDSPRPVVLYLFSTHFGQKAPIEEALAADPANLSWTQAGPLGKDVYYQADIFNWSFASTANQITARRVEAARAVLEEVCRLPAADVKKIRGITLLGELHHLFPKFESGMGYTRPYLITDYGPASVAGFREYLRRQFKTIEAMNSALGSNWPSFDEVVPPSKDIRSQPLRDYTEHIDAYAHGFIPISGWAHVPGATDARPATALIYRNARLVGKAPIALGRQDVLAAVPELGTANTGWRYDLDFRNLPNGVHRIHVLLDDNSGRDPILLGMRDVAIMDKRHQTPEFQPQAPLRPHRAADPKLRAYIDLPENQSSYFYNPMVPLWHAFRGQQVVDYLQYFRQQTQLPCLRETPRFTHQIIPFTNPSWDENKFAIDASLQKLEGLSLGISLYGEPTYGPTFAQWYGRSGHKAYGITEFHPLKALDEHQLRQVVDAHADRGAVFLSFFMEPRWKGKRAAKDFNLFSFEPENPSFGSPQLYESARALLAGARTAATARAPAATASGAARTTP